MLYYIQNTFMNYIVLHTDLMKYVYWLSFTHLYFHSSAFIIYCNIDFFFLLFFVSTFRVLDLK